MVWLPGWFYTNFLLTSLVFFFVSYRIFKITVTLRDACIPRDGSRMVHNRRHGRGGPRPLWLRPRSQELSPRRPSVRPRHPMGVQPRHCGVGRKRPATREPDLCPTARDTSDDGLAASLVRVRLRVRACARRAKT